MEEAAHRFLFFLVRTACLFCFSVMHGVPHPPRTLASPAPQRCRNDHGRRKMHFGGITGILGAGRKKRERERKWKAEKRFLSVSRSGRRKI